MTDLKNIELDIGGMTCAACSARIEKVINKSEGVSNVTVNLTTEVAKITYDDSLIDKEDLIQKIERLGFTAAYKKSIQEKKREKLAELHTKRNTVIISALFCIPLLITMITHVPFLNTNNMPEFLMNPYFQFVFATPVQFYFGSTFYIGAFYALKNKSANMDVLVAIGTSAAYFYSLYETITWEGHTYGMELTSNNFYFETSAVLITLILFGKYLEANAKFRTSAAIEHLLSLQAKHAFVLIDGSYQYVPIEKVKKGSLVLVKPGEKIPIDGTIIEGTSTIDESMLTGESIPVTKKVNNQVFGGTINGHEVLQIRVTNTVHDSVLSQIIATVEEAQTKKAPIQRVADKISGIFVPIVIFLACITFIIWYFFVPDTAFSDSLQTAISVLVIACPCALGLATPTSIMVASGLGAEHGILFKGGEFIEEANTIDTVVFDKTGTITKGKPVVTNAKFFHEDALPILYSVEKNSEHPLADAIVSYAELQETAYKTIYNMKAIAGKGMTAQYESHFYFIGSKSYLLEHQINLPTDLWEEWEKEGKTVIGIGTSNKLLGMVAVRDSIREEAKDVVSILKKQGKTIYLLTGDNKVTAHAIADEIGITNVKAEVLPTEKALFIQQLIEEKKKVAMIGDGINDAPALVKANLGLAMGNGTDIAVEAADVTLLSNSLLLVPKIFNLSSKAMKNIRQNLFWAFFYNCIGIPVAAFGLLAPWVAGAAMALSSVSVVTNALRLKKAKITV